jgi:23S rRNA pseudouridine2457 synthase
MKKHRHFKLHKPDGYISQFKHNGRRKKKLLGDLYDFPEGCMSIGRLDEDSEGLLLLTTDGKESYHITSSKVEKEYYVQVDGIIDQDAIERMKVGVDIGLKGIKYRTKPCNAKLLHEAPNFADRNKRIRDDRHGPRSWASITLREGKYKQVRKMTAAVGFPTLRLVRVRIGSIHLESLKAGDVVELEAFEL